MSAPQLNIKDAETTAMVRELAELTGESQTQAVRTAVRQRLERERSARVEEIEKTLQNLREVSRAGAKNKLSGATSDHSFLYDSFGAPI